MRAIKTRKGTTLAIGRVDAGLGRCGQVVTTARIVELGLFAVNGAPPILIIQVLSFVSHDNVIEEACKTVMNFRNAQYEKILRARKLASLQVNCHIMNL